VFEGGAYGVGVTLTSLEPVPWPEVPLPAGVEVHPARLGEMMPVAARTHHEQAAELERVNRVEAQLAAYKTELIAGLAAFSSTADDRSVATAPRRRTTTRYPASASSSPTSWR
jgi:hypothetical protein